MTSAASAAEAIGPYLTIRQLGSGGMGEVFLAHDASLGRDVAIKLLPEHLASEADNLARLRQEARTASSLNHPNIITIYEIGEHDSGAFMAMEYVDGTTLRDLLGSGAVPVRKALQIAAQIADGLAAAHKRGLVHRDLKPENVMITTDGVVKILDFGLAKSAETPGAIGSDPGTIVGSYGYMAPEQARAGSVDYRADQFALGAILYEMLTGSRAFDGASGVETLFMIVRDEPQAVSQIAPHVPAPVRWVVDRCLSKDADDRYVSTRDLARELQYIRDHFSEAGVATPIRDEENVGAKIKRIWPIAAVIVAALAIGAVATAIVRRPAPRTITSERYLTYSGNDYSPAVSPDGKLIAFSSNRDGTLRIWIKQVAGGGEVALTSGVDDFPRFSHDGSMVLYAHAEQGRPASLWRIPVVGGEARRVVDNAGTGEWSPDGKQIAFTRNVVGEVDNAASILFVANADGGSPRELTRSPATLVAHPRWSPDGKWIATVGARGRTAQSILLTNAATGETKFLAVPPKAGEVSSVIWNADSESVLYVRAESVEAVVGSSAQIVRHDIDKDVFETVGWTSHNGVVLDVLEDGKLVLDVRSPRDNLRELGLGGAAAEQWITRGNSSDRQPVYAPDGKTLLFTSNRSGNLDLWTIDRATGAVRRVTDDAAEDWDPAYTRDGQKIVWSAGRSGNLEIWIANADGSDAHQISKDGYDAENPSATADGQWIVYNSFHPDKSGVWKVKPDGSGASLVVAGRTAVPEVSPDGRYVAYIANARTVGNEIRVASVADGADTGFQIQIRNTRRTTSIMGRMRWMPDGRAIAFLGQDPTGVNGVFVQDFVPGQDTTATRRQLGGFDRERATESFGIAGDGKSMTVAGWEQLFSLFSVEGVPEIKTKRSEQKESR
jgi:Tol biopolymer transport system component/serine/threonine protein kinase